jgi:DHA3 family macrolide efflux protein-like MFS transporter
MKAPPRANIRRLALGRCISVTGGASAFTALGYTVWHQTHDPWLQALAFMLTFGVSGLVGPFAGALGDHFDRRKVMIWSETIAASFFFVMAFAVHSPMALIMFAFASAVAEAPFWAASRAATPNLAETDEDIAWANSLIGIGWSSGVAIGPVLGGVIVAAGGPSWVFAINGVSFLVSVLLTASVRGSYADQRTQADIDEHRGITAGVRHLLGEPVLRRMCLALFIFVLGAGMGMVADAALAESFGVGSVGFGAIVTCWGLGAVIGNGSGRWLTAQRELRWVVWGAGGIGLAATGVGFSPVFPLALISLLAFGICDGLSIVAENGVIQRRTPDAVRSRALAGFEALASIGLAIAYLAAGPMLSAVGPRVLYRITGVTAAVSFVLLLPLLRVANDAPGVETPAAMAPAADLRRV